MKDEKEFLSRRSSRAPLECLLPQGQTPRPTPATPPPRDNGRPRGLSHAVAARMNGASHDGALLPDGDGAGDVACVSLRQRLPRDLLGLSSSFLMALGCRSSDFNVSLPSSLPPPPPLSLSLFPPISSPSPQSFSLPTLPFLTPSETPSPPPLRAQWGTVATGDS